MKSRDLASKLKRLRLSGMLESLEMRLGQAETEKLGYLEFMELLLEDEISRRSQNALADRVAKARFKEIKSIHEFDFNYNPDIPAALIRDLVTCRFIEKKESVLLFGPVGVGKSHVALAIGYAACQQGYSVLYQKASKLLSDLAGGHADGTFERRLRKYVSLDLLILDDFAMKEFTPPQAEDIYELICERHMSGSTIVVSNRSPKDWYALFPNPVLAEGVLDRLINSSHHVLMKGKSYRPLRRPEDPISERFATGVLP